MLLQVCQSWHDDRAIGNEEDESPYAYASREGMVSESARMPRVNDAQHEPYNKLDFSGKPKIKPSAGVDAEYNTLGVGSIPVVQAAAGSAPGAKYGNVRLNTYEEAAESLPSTSTDDNIDYSGNKGMPPYAKVDKRKKSTTVTPLILKENLDDGNAPLSPRYTVVEPDLSASDPEDAEDQQTHSAGPLYEDTKPKPMMPPYAKVNKKKKNSVDNNIQPDIYNRLERPLGTFSIEDDKPAEDQPSEYSHLMNKPPVKQGYSKLEYGSPPSHTSRPRLLSGNVYSQLQVPPENDH